MYVMNVMSKVILGLIALIKLKEFLLHLLVVLAGLLSFLVHDIVDNVACDWLCIDTGCEITCVLCHPQHILKKTILCKKVSTFLPSLSLTHLPELDCKYLILTKLGLWL